MEPVAPSKLIFFLIHDTLQLSVIAYKMQKMKQWQYEKETVKSIKNSSMTR